MATNIEIHTYIDDQTKKALELNKDYYIEKKGSKKPHTLIKIPKINLIDQNDTFYSITYLMNILPSGRFEIIHQNEYDFIGYTSTITLYLGKKFQCFKNCVEKGVNIEYYGLNTAKEITLEILDDKGIQHVFWLTAIKDIRVEQGIWLGLLVSSIISLFLIIKEWCENYFSKKRNWASNQREIIEYLLSS